MPSLSVHSAGLRSRPGQSSYPADEAMKLLLTAGFTMTREKNHRIMRKGDKQFTLPTTGWVNPNLSKLVRGYYHEWLDEHNKSPESKKQLPLQVRYKNQSWAVLDETEFTYRLQSLEDGRAINALKSECQEDKEFLMSEISNNRVEQAAEILEPIEIEREPARAVPMGSFANESDTAALIRLAQRRLERLDIERQQVYNRLAEIDKLVEATRNFVASLGGITTTPAAPVVETKRQPGKSLLSSAENDRVRMIIMDSGGSKASAGEVRDKLEKVGIHLAYQSVYSRIKTFRNQEAKR